MAHNHGHSHRITLIPSQKNYKLYLGAGLVYLFFIVLAGIATWWSNAHASYVNLIHAVEDLSNIFVTAWLAWLCRNEKISIKRFDWLASRWNTALLALAAVTILFELFIEHHASEPFFMALNSGFIYFGNDIQHKMLHEAHGHEDHGHVGDSGFLTTLQHVIIDKMFAVSVMIAAAWIQFQLPGYEYIDKIVAASELGLLCWFIRKNTKSW